MAKHYVKVGNRVKLGEKFFVARRNTGVEDNHCGHCAFNKDPSLRHVCEKDLLACGAEERNDKYDIYFEALK